MSDPARNRARARILAVAIPLAMVVLPLVYGAVDYLAPGEAPLPEARFGTEADPTTACVRDAEFMRYHHWQLLKDVREEVMRHGRRGTITMNGCRECHPDRGRFCNQCHDQVDLRPDCFGCHYYPETPQATETATHAAPTPAAP